MAEFETGGNTYKTEKMSARDQLHLLRGLGPLFAPMAQIALSGTSSDAIGRLSFMVPFFEAFSKMEQKDVDTLVNRCFAVTRRRVATNGAAQWSPPLWSGARDQYEDLDLGSLMTICWEVIQENLGGFFAIGTAPESDITALSPPPMATVPAT